MDKGRICCVRTLVAMLTCMLLAGCAAGSGQKAAGMAATAEAGSGHELYYADTFDDTSNWQLYGVKSSVADGQLRVVFPSNVLGPEPGTVSKVMFHPMIIFNPRVPVEDLLVEWQGIAGKSGFEGWIGPYYFAFGGKNNTLSGAGLEDLHSTKFTPARKGPVYTPGTMHTWRVLRRGRSLAGFIDDQLIFQKLLDPVKERPRGQVKLVCSGGELILDSMVVHSLP